MKQDNDNLILTIGHPVYVGVNSIYYAASIADAMRELRARGATRDGARRAINRAKEGALGTCSTGLLGYDVTEVSFRHINPMQVERLIHYSKRNSYQ